MKKPPASMVWVHESNVVIDEEVLYQERFADPSTGVRPLRLTTFPFGNAHIYPEAQVGTPGGNRFIFVRYHPPCGFRTYWMADLDTLAVRQVTDEPDATPPAVAPDGSAIYYAAGNTIWRMSPDSFERERAYEVPAERGVVTWPMTVSSCSSRLAVAWAGGEEGGLMVFDAATHEGRVVFSHRDVRNAHAQYCRGPGHLLLVQINDGMVRDDAGNVIRMVGDLGCRLCVMGDDGSGLSTLPIGVSPTERVQGHQCWMGRDPTVITPIHRRDGVAAPWRQDRIVAYTLGDDAYRVVCESGDAAFTHIHSTLDGRFFLTDCNRTGRIYVGSTRTGRMKRFCDSGASFGAHQSTHPHPFFLPGDQTIGWNSDATGVTQVMVARIPDGFLEELESRGRRPSSSSS